jgi:preprotein translocase subunit SecF
MRIISKAKYFSAISVLIITIGIIVALFAGVNLGIDFTGGTLMTVEMGSEFEVGDVSAVLDQNGVKDAPVVKSSADATSEATQAQIRLKEIEGVKSEQLRADILDDIQVNYPDAQIYQAESIGAVTSAEIIRNAILAVLIACVLMLGYIWIRFELYSGISALVALVHDVLIMTAVITVFRQQINSPYIAACLTIVGYSINDTIVLFDRIRENNRKFSHREYSREEVADRSIKETLSRTINTSVTTLVTITCLYIFGVDSIKEFALPLIIGLISGTYSSIFIASPIWVKLMNSSLKRLGIKHKKTSKVETV